jgi:energy-coupling factor transport system substrate-specific component
MSSNTFRLTFAALCVVVNLALGTAVQMLQIPLVFLDTLGTILGAVLFGPLSGGLIGLTTNLVQGFLTNPRDIPFALVNVAIGLIVGFVSRRMRFTLPVALVVGVVLAVTAPLIGTPIAVWIYGGLTGGGTDFLFLWLRASGQSIFTSAFIPRITGNLIDKVACCVLVALVLPKLPPAWLARSGNPNLAPEAGTRTDAPARD